MLPLLGTIPIIIMIETNPKNVREAHLAAFSGKMNMVQCANHCGLTLREFKMAFREFLKYNSPTYTNQVAEQLNLF